MHQLKVLIRHDQHLDLEKARMKDAIAHSLYVRELIDKDLKKRLKRLEK